MSGRKGSVSQRDLVPMLKELVDAASAPNSTAHRDLARATLRRVLTESNYNTSFIWNNIGPRRARYIAGLGYPVPMKWMNTYWKKRPGEDKA